MADVIAPEIVVRETSNKSFSVEDFRKSFNKGTASPALFNFTVFGKGDVGEKLSTRVKTAHLPDLGIETYQHSYNGIPVKYPLQNATDNLSIEVIASSNLLERNFFIEWQKEIIDYNTSSSEPTYNVGYLKDYAHKGQLDLYDVSTKRTIKYEFENMWPVNVGQVQLDWSLKDEVIVFPVTLSYSYWTYYTI